MPSVLYLYNVSFFNFNKIMSGKIDLFTSVIVLAVGIALICLYQRVDILDWIVILIGIMFMIPGIFSLVSGISSRMSGNVASVIAGIGAIVLGAVMCIFPTPFAHILVYIFAGILIVGGIYHIAFIGWLSKPFILPWYYYIIPVLMIIAGLLMIFTDLRTINSVVVLITGISLVCSSFNSLIEWVATHPSKKKEIEDNV